MQLRFLADIGHPRPVRRKLWSCHGPVDRHRLFALGQTDLLNRPHRPLVQIVEMLTIRVEEWEMQTDPFTTVEQALLRWVYDYLDDTAVASPRTVIERVLVDPLR